MKLRMIAEPQLVKRLDGTTDEGLRQALAGAVAPLALGAASLFSGAAGAAPPSQVQPSAQVTQPQRSSFEVSQARLREANKAKGVDSSNSSALSIGRVVPSQKSVLANKARGKSAAGIASGVGGTLANPVGAALQAASFNQVQPKK